MGILDFLFPKKCAGCGRSGTYFCPNCVAAARLHFPQVCPVCERASLDGVGHAWCRQSFAPQGLTAIWVYEGVPRKLILKLKYRYVAQAAESLAAAAVDFFEGYERSSLQSPDWQKEKFLLVPIPLHWTRKNWRGFNHSEEIGRLMAGLMGWQAAPLLLRKKRTLSQVGLKEKQRKENIQDAFTLSPNASALPRSSVLLFDDVWTTGATMMEATKVLKKAGFRRVWCLTLAR